MASINDPPTIVTSECARISPLFLAVWAPKKTLVVEDAPVWHPKRKSASVRSKTLAVLTSHEMIGSAVCIVDISARNPIHRPHTNVDAKCMEAALNTLDTNT